MKIGILTYHKSINYGAVTQCYSLATQIKKDFPEDTVEVIDYAPLFRINAYKVSLRNYIFGNLSKNNSLILNTKILAYQILKLIFSPKEFHYMKMRYIAFQNSMKTLPLSKEKYHNENADDFRKIIKDKYDVIVVGSDCVWEWSTVPLPNAYYLYGNYGAVKVSYAVSAGTDDYRLLSESDCEELANAISEFAYIGVRDTATEYNVKGLCPQARYYHNCDPTTFLDLNELSDFKAIVNNKLVNSGIDFSKPIIGIMGNEKIGKLAHDIFGDSVQYVGIYTYNKYCDVFLGDLEVLEWATVFGYFDLTFTTYFHGTMLSLVNGTPVLSFDYLPETETQITKLHELYSRLDLPGFYHSGKRDYTNNDIIKIGALAKQFITNPPKAQIRQELQKESQYYNSFKYFLDLLHKDDLNE